MVRRFLRIFVVDPRFTGNKPKMFLVWSVFFGLINPREWRYLSSWVRSLRRVDTDVPNTVPWITYGAAGYLKGLLKKNFTVFEYGSGGSTFFFAERVKRVISVEHDKEWFSRLRPLVPANVEYLFEQGKKTKTPNYYSSCTNPSLAFESYVNKINDYNKGGVDLVMVDGRARVQCVLAAIKIVRPGGYIVLDNSDRNDYYGAHMALKRIGAVPRHFFGLTFSAPNLTQTTVWRVPE